MKPTPAKILLGLAWFVLGTAAAGADELTVESNLTMHRSGAPADVMVQQVASPANTLAMRAGDLPTLEGAVQEKLGEARRKVGDLVRRVAESIEK